MERHEIERIKIEQDEENMQYQWEAFKPDAVDRVEECFEKNDDLLDLINKLDGDWDDYHSLEDDQINEIVLEAALRFKANQEAKKDREHEGQTFLPFNEKDVA